MIGEQFDNKQMSGKIQNASTSLQYTKEIHYENNMNNSHSHQLQENTSLREVLKYIL